MQHYEKFLREIIELAKESPEYRPHARRILKHEVQLMEALAQDATDLINAEPGPVPPGVDEAVYRRHQKKSKKEGFQAAKTRLQIARSAYQAVCAMK